MTIVLLMQWENGHAVTPPYELYSEHAMNSAVLVYSLDQTNFLDCYIRDYFSRDDRSIPSDMGKGTRATPAYRKR